MVKALLISFAIFALFNISSASENNLDSIDISIPIPQAPFKQILQMPLATDPQSATLETISMIEKMYRSTMVKVLGQKVFDVQRKIINGENAFPEAIDILKLTLLSQPTNDVTIRKAAENVFSKISPHLTQAAGQITAGLYKDLNEFQKQQN